jgi:microcystin-dependent protein
MSDQYLGEIRMAAFNFAPIGWATCSGQLLSISQNTALFSLLGTYYGGNGTSNFALPNLQARAAMGYGNGAGLSQRFWGETGGEYSVTLINNQMPQHNHPAACISGGGSLDSPNVPGNAVWAADGAGRGVNLYATVTSTVSMNPMAVQVNGGNLPHNNVQPCLAITFIIALQGIYPQRP